MEYRKLYYYKNERSLWEILIKAHLMFKKVDINEQTILVLSYMCEMGINTATQKEIIKQGVCPHRQGYYNCRLILQSKGLIKKIRQGEWVVTEPLASLKIGQPLDFMVRCKILNE